MSRSSAEDTNQDGGERGDDVSFEELKERASQFQPQNGVEEDLLPFLHFEIGEVERVRDALAANRAWIRSARRGLNFLLWHQRHFGAEAKESGRGAGETGQKAKAKVRETTKREQSHGGGIDR
jgi:hypothetical protein